MQSPKKHPVRVDPIRASITSDLPKIEEYDDIFADKKKTLSAREVIMYRKISMQSRNVSSIDTEAPNGHISSGNRNLSRLNT